MNFDLCGNLLLQELDVADNSDAVAVLMELFGHADSRIK